MARIEGVHCIMSWVAGVENSAVSNQVLAQVSNPGGENPTVGFDCHIDVLISEFKCTLPGKFYIRSYQKLFYKTSWSLLLVARALVLD